MRLLLDTQAVLWFRTGNPRLSITARRAIEDTNNELLFSLAGVWELSIKIALKRLQLDWPLREFVESRLTESGVQLLDILPQHIYAVLELPHLHGDPFDRLMTAQCMVEKLHFVSADAQIDAYGVARIW